MSKGTQYDIPVTFIMNMFKKHTQLFAQYGVEHSNSRGCNCTFSFVFWPLEISI